MEHLAQLVQLLSQEADAIEPLFVDKGFDRLELEDRCRYPLPGLVVKIVREAKPLFLLRAHDAAAQIVALGRAMLNESVRRQ